MWRDHSLAYDRGMQQILDGIFTWSWLSPAHGYHFNGYLLRLPAPAGPPELVCVDPVNPEPHELGELIAARPSRILLTNRNHVRAANLVREHTGARTAIHPLDAERARALGAHLDDELHVGDRIGPLEVVAAAGKSPGEVALHWPARRLLIVGDALIGNPPGRCCLLRPQVIDDLAQLKASVRALLRLDFDTLLVGDGVPILTGAKAAVEALVGSFGD